MIQVTDNGYCLGRKSMQIMKRLFQFIAFALVLLAAAQPMLVDTVCVQPQCGGTPDCYTHLGCMATPDFAMQSLLATSQATPQVAFAESGCTFGWCWLRSDSSKSRVATPQIFAPASSSPFFMPVAQFSTSPAVVLAARSSENGAADNVPRHILFRVFRI